MPPGPTSPVQGSDQDGGVDTHLSESRHAPGPTSSDASRRTRMEEWTPTHLSPKMPPGPTSPVQRSDQWILTHLSPDMPLVQLVVMQAIGPGWRSGHPLV